MSIFFELLRQLGLAKDRVAVAQALNDCATAHCATRALSDIELHVGASVRHLSPFLDLEVPVSTVPCAPT
jgi:cell division inhibitor SulA